MKNSKLLFQDFVKQIRLPESQDELSSIAHVVFEHVFGISRTEVLAAKPIPVTAANDALLLQILQRLNQHEPLQYILGEADFFGRKFMVNASVLIPRPETEELVNYILQESTPGKAVKILDIGTGSGCIPITLALEIKGSEVYATDISTEALAVAKVNAEKLAAKVSFIEHDILRSEIPVNDVHVVVSNPPYIGEHEQWEMKENVVKFEPHLALFVKDDDPLIFYKTIAAKAKKVLRSGGILAVEINEKYGSEVSAVFAENGFRQINVIKDLQGKDRIVHGTQG